jgi:hypothetical protein
MKRDDVLEIANRLKNEGRAISPVTVCLEAYGQSLPEIAETLQQWRDERMTPVDAGLATLPTPDDFGDVMRDAIERCWAVAQKGVRGQVDAEMRALRERTEQAERETGMLYIDLTRTLHELEAYKRKLAEFQHSPAGATRLISPVEENPVPAIAQSSAVAASDLPAETESHLSAFEESSPLVEEHAHEASLESEAVHEQAVSEDVVAEHAEAEYPAQEHVVSEDGAQEHAVLEHAVEEYAMSEHAPQEHAVLEDAAQEHAVSEHAAQDFAPDAVAFGETEAVHHEAAFEEAAQAPAFESHLPVESTEGFAGFDQQEPLAAEPENANILSEQLALAEARACAAEARVQELEAELAVAAQAAHVPAADPSAAHAAQEEAAQRIAEIEQAFAQERQALQTKLDEAILHCAQWKQRAEQLRADFTPLKEHAAWVNAQSVGRSTLCSRLIVELARVSPGNPLLRKEVQQQIVDQAAQTHAG